MIKYYFQAVSTDGKTISGTLESENEYEAREKLANARLAILDLEVFDPAKHKVEEGFLFEFRGTNKDGNTISGTITSPDKYKAYVQLIQDYGLELESLFRADGNPDEKTAEKAQGLGALKSQFEEENRVDQSPQSQTAVSRDEEMVKRALAAQQEQKSFLSESLNQFSGELDQALEANDLFISPEKKRIVKRTFDQIQVIKQSNNISHLEKMLSRLFEILRDDTMFLPLSQVDPDLHAEYDRSKKNFVYFVSKARREVQTGMKDLETVSNVETRHTIEKSLITTVAEQGYVIALVFFFLGALSLLGGGIGKFLKLDGLYALFQVFGTSLSFWYFMGVAAMVVGLWALQFEGGKLKKGFYKFIIGLVFLVFYTLNAPTLFFWTI